HASGRIWFVPIGVEDRLPALIPHHFHDGVLVIPFLHTQPLRRVQQFLVTLLLFRSTTFGCASWRSTFCSAIPLSPAAHPPSTHRASGPARARSAIPDGIAG